MGTPFKSSREIRNEFIEFFREKDHKFVRSSPVVASDDPTLLFINAGMNQFKSIFLGENKDNLTRVVNSQKCIRVSGKHNDLEVVGKDTYHHTFFEMLGNWSFGDYYKQEAIAWAWELLTDKWDLAPDRLFVTVHDSDDEAAEIWKKVSGLPPEKIMKFGDKENFWEMGEVGPCGPCSEIHYDTGGADTRESTFADPVQGVNCENDRYLEIWNLVFIQYQRMNSGELKPLKQKHVDTGMGLERICAILQEKGSNYDTDLFVPVITRIAELSGVPYQPGLKGMPHRVIADHLRALSFAVTDGGLPGNEGRGYVLRRILRRASRFSRSLEQKEPFICRLVPVLIEEMGEAFAELKAREDFVTRVIRSEEERFIKTLDQGLDRFRKISDSLKHHNKTEVSGSDAFTLYDTYGFPLDLTCLIAEEQGLTVDKDGYEQCMDKQHDRARQAAKFDNALANEEGWVILSPEARSKFTGYEILTGQGRLLRYRLDKNLVYAVLDQSPFYAESGGQVGDTGIMECGDTVLKVLDTFKLMDMIVHKCKLLKGALSPDSKQEFNTEVDKERRQAIMRNHSATHLLQGALRNVLGEHVQQTGSRVGPEDLRFDFTHHQAVSEQEIDEVENLVNQAIMDDPKIWDVLCPLDEAKRHGAIALFGEKYADEVRIITMGDYSIELCGGTHVAATGRIGLMKIVSESSIASGVRRITAITGTGLLDYLRRADKNLDEIRRTLKAKPGAEAQKVLALSQRSRQQEKELEQLRNQQSGARVDSYLADAKQAGDYKYVLIKAGGLGKDELSSLADSLAPKLGATVAVITNASIGSLSILVLVGKDMTGKVKAGDLVKELAAHAGGKGGGRADRAQAGSKKPEMEPVVMAEAEKILKERLSQF